MLSSTSLLVPWSVHLSGGVSEKFGVFKIVDVCKGGDVCYVLDLGIIKGKCDQL